MGPGFMDDLSVGGVGLLRVGPYNALDLKDHELDMKSNQSCFNGAVLTILISGALSLSLFFFMKNQKWAQVPLYEEPLSEEKLSNQRNSEKSLNDDADSKNSDSSEKY